MGTLLWLAVTLGSRNLIDSYRLAQCETVRFTMARREIGAIDTAVCSSQWVSSVLSCAAFHVLSRVYVCACAHVRTSAAAAVAEIRGCIQFA